MASTQHRNSRCQDALAGVGLFSDLSKAQLRSVARLMTCVKVPAGRALTTEGEVGREFMGVIRTTFIINKQGKVVHIMDNISIWTEMIRKITPN